MFPARSPAVRPHVIASVALAENLRELRDGVLLGTPLGCYRQFPGTSGKVRTSYGKVFADEDRSPFVWIKDAVPDQVTACVDAPRISSSRR